MNKDVYIQIRVDRDLKERVQTRLEAEERTLSDLLREFLEEYAGDNERTG